MLNKKNGLLTATLGVTWFDLVRFAWAVTTGTLKNKVMEISVTKDTS